MLYSFALSECEIGTCLNDVAPRYIMLGFNNNVIVLKLKC